MFSGVLKLVWCYSLLKGATRAPRAEASHLLLLICPYRALAKSPAIHVKLF